MADQNDLKINPAGLWTAPSVIEAPRGGLQDASEIVIRRIGMAEPRPGFSQDTTSLPVATLDTKRILEREALDGTFEQLGVGTHTGAYQIYLSGTGEIKERTRNITSGAYSSASLTNWTRDKIWGINARGNLYMTASDGLRVRSSTNAGAITAGQPFRAGQRTPHVLVSATAAGQALIVGGYVTYRALVRFTDENGVITRSGVSGRVVAGPGTGNQVTLDVIGSLCVSAGSAGYPAGSAVEIYRTENSLTYPPIDEHFYVGELPLTGVENVTTGFAAFTDNVLDVDLGTALYTNALEQGAAADHVQIPTAGCGAMFNGSLFLGNLSYAPSQLLYIPHSTTAIGVADTTSVGLRRRTSTLTNGSDQITGIADMTGLLVGMIVGVGPTGWAGPGFMRLTALNVGASSATMSAVYTGGTVTATVSYWDSILIGSKYFPIYVNLAGPTLVYTAAFIRGAVITGTMPATTVPADFGSTTVQADLVGLDGQSGGYLNLYMLYADQTTPRSFTLAATHGAAYNPALPETTATPLTVAQEDQPNGIAWSNNMEPEHFTGVNEDQIAPTGKIMAMISLGNGLLVFMTKGLWRVAGSGAESGFRFDQLDQDMRLVYPYAVTRLKDKAYAHGDKGIHECDENIAVQITGLNLRDRLQPVQELAGVGSATGSGFFAVTNRKADEVCFSVPTTSDLTVGERLYVYNVNTQAWTNWLIGSAMTCGLAKSGGAVLSWFDSVLNAWRLERAGTASPVYTVDKSGTATTSATGASVVLSAATWTAEAGDLIQDPAHTSEYFLVLSMAGSTATLDRAYTTQGAGTANLWKSFTSTITPLAVLAASPGYLKCWGEGRLYWGSLEGMYKMAVSCTSALSDTAVSQTRTLYSQRITRTGPESLRFVVPRNHARTTRLYPSLVIRQGGANWRLEGLDIGYRVSSDRVMRKR